MALPRFPGPGKIEKLAIEIRHLQRSEVDEAREPFGKEGFVTKGSSSMPHKRNPELSERICGLARVIRSNSSTALQNVPLWHERDISHSSAERVILPDSSIATDYILFLADQIISGLEIKRDNMLRNLDNSNGLIFSPRIMSFNSSNSLEYDLRNSRGKSSIQMFFISFSKDRICDM